MYGRNIGNAWARLNASEAARALVISLDTLRRWGGTVWTTDADAGPVAVVAYPWEVDVSRDTPDDSAVNHLRAPIVSFASLRNRVRVRVAPGPAEVTAASAERLGLREGEVVIASFKATGTRLLPVA